MLALFWVFGFSVFSVEGVIGLKSVSVEGFKGLSDLRR